MDSSNDFTLSCPIPIRQYPQVLLAHGGGGKLLTRGGLASALVEIAEVAGVNIKIDEIAIPVREDVRGAREILGFDPLYLANEGRFVAFVASPDAERALSILNSHPFGSGASIIGEVTSASSAIVTLKSRICATRIVDMFTGEQLPRIC